MPGEQCGQSVAARGDDLADALRRPGQDQFVAGREDRDPGRPGHRQRRRVHGCGQSHVFGREAARSREQRVAGAEVHALRAHVLAGGNAGVEPDDVSVALDDLLNDDGVCAFRNHGSGEDARRLARADPHRGVVARGQGADDPQRGGFARVRRPNCVAVHGRDRRAWMGDPGGDILGENAAGRDRQRNPLGLGRRDEGEDVRQGLRDGSHAVAIPPRNRLIGRRSCGRGEDR